MRIVLSLALPVLVLAACAPESEHDAGNSAAPAPSGLELASARSVAEAAPGSTVDLTTAQLSEMLSDGKVRLIDVRTAEEVAQGMIPGAEHIAMDAFDPAALDPADDRTIVLYCRSGRRSQIVGERLAGHTGTPTMHLAGGIIAWEADGHPVQ